MADRLGWPKLELKVFVPYAYALSCSAMLRARSGMLGYQMQKEQKIAPSGRARTRNSKVVGLSFYHAF